MRKVRLRNYSEHLNKLKFQTISQPLPTSAKTRTCGGTNSSTKKNSYQHSEPQPSANQVKCVNFLWITQTLTKTGLGSVNSTPRKMPRRILRTGQWAGPWRPMPHPVCQDNSIEFPDRADTVRGRPLRASFTWGPATLTRPARRGLTTSTRTTCRPPPWGSSPTCRRHTHWPRWVWSMLQRWDQH